MTAGGGDESHSLRGPVDRGALADFRDAVERQEPLATGRLDDVLDPRELTIDIDDGVGSAQTSRLDVTWTTRGDYNVHYTDSAGRNLRWDVHPNDFPAVSDDRHFHPPPQASSDPRDVEPSCIEVSTAVLVARAVVSLWRRAYEKGTLEEVNAVTDPP